MITKNHALALRSMGKQALFCRGQSARGAFPLSPEQAAKFAAGPICENPGSGPWRMVEKGDAPIRPGVGYRRIADRSIFMALVVK
jgi:hypothetical protein